MYVSHQIKVSRFRKRILATERRESRLLRRKFACSKRTLLIRTDLLFYLFYFSDLIFCNITFNSNFFNFSIIDHRLAVVNRDKIFMLCGSWFFVLWSNFNQECCPLLSCLASPKCNQIPFRKGSLSYICWNYFEWTGEQGLVDEAQKALEEAEALKKVPHVLNLFAYYFKLLNPYLAAVFRYKFLAFTCVMALKIWFFYHSFLPGRNQHQTLQSTRRLMCGLWVEFPWFITRLNDKSWNCISTNTAKQTWE